MRRSHAVAALAAVPPLTAIAAWWLIGDVSEPGDPQYLDYMFHPPAISRGVERAIGASATVLLVGCAAAAIHAWRQGQIDRDDRRAATPLVIAAVCAAFAERVLTAGVGGANIGGGLIMLLAPFVLVPLLVVGAVRWHRILRNHHHIPD